VFPMDGQGGFDEAAQQGISAIGAMDDYELSHTYTWSVVHHYERTFSGDSAMETSDGIADYLASEKYLSTSPTMAGVIGKFEKGTTTIVLISDGNDRYDPASNTLYWDPHSALATTSGGRQSPALGLGHEMTHETGGKTADRLAGIPDQAYDNAEERRVIVNYETPAANQLGEGTRMDHSCDHLYGVSSPTQY